MNKKCVFLVTCLMNDKSQIYLCFQWCVQKLWITCLSYIDSASGSKHWCYLFVLSNTDCISGVYDSLKTMKSPILLCINNNEARDSPLEKICQFCNRDVYHLNVEIGQSFTFSFCE